MALSTIDIIIIVLYMAGMLLLGFLSKSKVDDMDDFILGGKRFTTFALTGTIMATMVGSGMTIGSVGNAYEFGITGTVFWVYLGFSVGLITFAFMSKKVRQTNARTMAEMIYIKYGSCARLVASIVIIAYAISIVAINIAGLRTVILTIFGDSINISIPLLTAIATLFAIFYTSNGGLYAVVWMDTIQLWIIIIGILFAGSIIGVLGAGGMGHISDTFESLGLSVSNPFATGFSASSLGFFLAYFLTVPADPAMPQRALSGKNDIVVKRAFFISSIMGLFFGLGLLLIGTSARIIYPDLPNRELALTHFILHSYPPVLKGITVVGIFGAIMSSFDSFLVLATTHVIYDVGTIMKKTFDEKTTKKILSIGTIIIGLIGLCIALFITSLFNYLYMVFSVIGSSLVPALIGGLYFEDKVTSVAAITSMIVGALVPAVLYLTVGYDVFLGDPVFLGIITSTFTLVIISLLTKKTSIE